MSEISMNEYAQILKAHTAALNRHSDELAAVRGASTGKSSAGGSGSAGASAGKKGPTTEDVKKKFTEFLSTGDKGLKDERGAWLKKLTKKLGVTRITEVAGEDIAKALDELKKRLESEKEADSSSDEGDDDESII